MPNPTHQGTVAGIVEVCRWLATVNDVSPVTRRARRAWPGSIEDEIAATQAAIDADTRPVWIFDPPGWGTGVVVCFTWAWRGGDLPIWCFEFDHDAGPA